MNPDRIEVSVLAASTHTMCASADRLITFRLRYPRFIHAEVMTHKLPRRNGASSRANGVSKMLKVIFGGMAAPVEWGKDQRGMFATEHLKGFAKLWVKFWWYFTGYQVLFNTFLMNLAKPHKQYANRMAEPWAFINVQYTLTYGELMRIGRLRTASDAQPEIQVLFSKMIWEARRAHFVHLGPDEWHLPWITGEEFATQELHDCINVSISRSARISYTPDGKVVSRFSDDTRLARRLWRQEHLSTAEHQFKPAQGTHAGIRGWVNARTLAECGKLPFLT